MTSPRFTFAGRFAGLWSVIRALTRDDAYEQYLAHHAAHHPHTDLLSRREFYLREQQRKWGGITRCC
jgi:uncharacterized short protein YbdD (DUF466 family)